MKVGLDLLAGSYESRDNRLEFQRTVNMYPETFGNKAGLMSWPGKTSLSAALTNDRGMYEFEGTYLQVASTTLYTVNMVTGVRTSVGTISGTARCTFSSNAGLCVIANGEGTVYQYDKTTLSTITDSDLNSPYFADMINNQWIYGNNKTLNSFDVSDAGLPGTINSLNTASAESAGDILVRPYVFRQIVWMMGERTCEPWWNTGSGTPPFDRQEGGILPKGLHADYSVAHSDEAMYWLGDDLKVYQNLNGQLIVVSTDGLWYEISQYATSTDAIGSVIQVGNQDIYILQFPTQDVTWAYSQQKNFWFQLSSGTQYGRYDASSFVEYNGAWYVSGFDAAIYKLDYTKYTENGSTLVRERVTQSYDAEYFGSSNQKVYWDSLTIRCTVGEGVNDTTPIMTLTYSDDESETFGTDINFDLGELGERDIVPRISGLGSAYRRKFKLRCTDDVPFNIYELKADVRLGI